MSKEKEVLQGAPSARKTMKPAAKWTNDCQGKKDYDGPLVDISVRYWPRGGGIDVLTAAGKWEGNEDRPEIQPSASASLLLRYDGDEYVTLVEQDFMGDTEAEVKLAVEWWVQARFDEVAVILQRHFGTKPAD